MEESLQTIDIKKFRSLFPFEYDASLGDDFFIADIHYDEALKRLDYPCRFNGYMALFCVKGEIELDINLKTYKMEDNTLMICIPGYIIRASGNQDKNYDGLHCILIGMSQEYFSSIHIDINRLFKESMNVLDNPCIHLGEEELRICRKYLDLASDIMASSLPSKREAVGSIISSVFYLMGSLLSRHLSEAKKNLPASVRTKKVFEDFLKLVSEYHSSQRNMAFYAEKLCLTPKYLSKLIKQASGRSAPEWIDSFVILEAKNLLKYSDDSIKEIVYRLNFPNQSVFYKFFKTHTGMTPSEYRNC